jgi:hypothetical protein
MLKGVELTSQALTELVNDLLPLERSQRSVLWTGSVHTPMLLTVLCIPFSQHRRTHRQWVNRPLKAALLWPRMHALFLKNASHFYMRSG